MPGAGDGLDGVSRGAWERLAQRRIYFGHQSVGYNIIEGVRELLREHGDIGLRIVESRDAGALATTGLVHSANGNNCDPSSKIRAFADLMNSGMGERADAAFFKLCYVDIEHGTDAGGVFKEYRETMADLAKRYPRVKFLHVTAPLTTVASDPKSRLKRMLGRPVQGSGHNARRAEYNRRLLGEFGPDAVFDLAAAECTGPRGDAATFRHEGIRCASLHPSLTDDGGHLGPQGRRIVGAAFLRWLAGAAA